jgi:hypothetical protein
MKTLIFITLWLNVLSGCAMHQVPDDESTPDAPSCFDLDVDACRDTSGCRLFGYNCEGALRCIPESLTPTPPRCPPLDPDASTLSCGEIPIDECDATEGCKSFVFSCPSEEPDIRCIAQTLHPVPPRCPPAD